MTVKCRAQIYSILGLIQFSDIYNSVELNFIIIKAEDWLH